MFGFALKFGFSQWMRSSKISSTLTPFYFVMKYNYPKLFNYTLVANCFNKPILSGASPVRKQRANNFNFSFVSSALLISFSVPYFWPKEDETDEENEIVMMMKRSILAMQDNQPEKAEHFLHLALKAAQEVDNQPAITNIYDIMGNLALQIGDFKKAETHFVNVLKRFLQRGMAENDNSAVEVSLKLANIYSHLGDYEKAYKGFQFCMETQESKLKADGEENVDEDTLVLWGLSHYWFAKFLLELNHYDKAKEHFKIAYDVCVKAKGEVDPKVAVLLNGLGLVCSLQQNYDEAIDYLNKAIYLATLHQNENLALFYVNLGTVYMQKKVYDEAEFNCKKGRKLAKKGNNEKALKESDACLKILKAVRK